MVSMIVGMVRINSPILVKHLTRPPGMTDRRFPRDRSIGLPDHRGQLALLAGFSGCVSVIAAVHGWLRDPTPIFRTYSSCLKENPLDGQTERQEGIKLLWLLHLLACEG